MRHHVITPRTGHTRCQRFAGQTLVWLLASVSIASSALGAAPKPSGGVDFGRQIRAVLSDNCFSCHGPDDKTRKGGLRLDLHEEALKAGKSGKLAIVPGKPDESELMRRIGTHDADDLMPPAKSGKQLSESQKALFRQWIAEGAHWTSHWAYEPPKRSEPPVVKNARWASNEIDRFVLARLEKEGLSPSPRTDKTTLIRRVTLDLTGLPPTPGEVDAFLADKSANAYEKVVDRLLQSPRYGEHMAKFWLDAARYADSHGYHIDSDRSMWKYRDWVVNAYNSGMPFDQFTVEQLAGDLLPSPTVDQKVASGYVRANMSTGEGGAIIDEYQAKYTFDRTETTSTIWMGLTMTCARCHTHKYDPITHKEYYGLYAFFNNLNESVMDGNAPNPDPSIQVPSAAQSSRLTELKGLISSRKARLDAADPAQDARQEAWEKRWQERLSKAWSVRVPDVSTSASNAVFETLADQSVRVGGPNPAQDVYELTYRVDAGPLAGLRLETLPDDSLPQKSSARADDGMFRLSEIEAEWTAGPEQAKPQALKFAQALADAAIADRDAAKAIDGKAETGWQPSDKATVGRHTALFLLAEPVSLPVKAEVKVRLKFQASVNKRSIGRFRIALARDQELTAALIPPKPQPWQVLGVLKAEDALVALNTPLDPEKSVDLKKTFPGVREEARWSARGDLEDGKDHVLVGSLHGVHGIHYLSRTLTVPADRTLEMSVRADDVFRVWVNGKAVGERLTKEKPGQGPLKTAVTLKAGENQILIKLVNIQGDSRFRFELSPLDESVLPPKIAVLFAGIGAVTPEQKNLTRAYFRRVTSPDWRKDSEELALWQEEETGLNRSIPMTLVAREQTEKLRETRMLIRGEYDKPGDVVSRGVPAILPPFPKDAPTNRLGLAQWLLLPSHPLTARVAVNRVWQQIFGIGFVKSPEDFGVQSEPPSHPELLDWLATEYVGNGWNTKALQKRILMSSTYQQSSQQTHDLTARDPENRLLARGSRFRVDGESIRDTALFVSGLMVEQQGGRSVKPYEPPGLWEAVSFNNSQKYVPDVGESRYRRSLYTHWKRQSPPPNMLIFDAPTREYCVVKRPRTNTPLQALALLNDPQFVEASHAFADRMLREGGASTESRLTYGFRLATGRKPAREELAVLKSTLEAQLRSFNQSPDSAKSYLSVGDFRPASTVPDAVLAAWSTLASMMLNLDETLTKI